MGGCILACMADERQLELIREGASTWNEWREEHTFTRVNLRHADLSGADLNGANLSNADIRWAKLIDADLSGADLRVSHLSGTDLSGANLSDADLGDAKLIQADLSGAKLVRAVLTRAMFIEAVLRDANLTEATLSFTFFVDMDLTKTLGPSSIDHKTLMRSSRLPLVFLRGCGLPDMYIDYLPSLVNQPIQFYSCFISYSTRDQDFAERLNADLQNKGVRCWFAPHDIKGGRKIHEQIDEAIRVYDRLLLILSEASMASEWVKTEIAHARQKELAQKRQVLFPISLVPYTTIRDWKCFDAAAGKDSAREIREYFIPDFSNWKEHNQYKVVFDRLMESLKSEAKA